MLFLDDWIPFEVMGGAGGGGSVADVFLDGDGGEEAEGEGHGVEAFFAEGEGGVPEADEEEQEGDAEGEPAEAVVDSGDGDALQAVTDGFLQGDGGEEAVDEDGEVVAFFVELHVGVPKADDVGQGADEEGDPRGADEGGGGGVELGLGRLRFEGRGCGPGRRCGLHGRKDRGRWRYRGH
jgi:hypothetical protein